MIDEKSNDASLSPEEVEDRIEVSQEMTQHVLEILGESWERIDQLELENQQLKDELATLRGEKTESAATAEAAEKPTAGKAAREPAGVLIIDDSRVLQLRFKSIIKSLGYDVIGVADDGEKGLRMALNRSPLLAIVDYNMPGLNGLQVVKAIREANSDMYLIVCAADLTARMSRLFVEAGANRILAKPVQYELFTSAIHEGMGKKGTASGKPTPKDN